MSKKEEIITNIEEIMYLLNKTNSYTMAPEVKREIIQECYIDLARLKNSVMIWMHDDKNKKVKI